MPSGKNITFSGTDTLAFIILPNTAPIVLGSLTTFSYSSYRIKTPVNTIGGIRIKGIAKGGRTIAGTMIFTLINRHWVNDLIEGVPWLKEKSDNMIYSDELPMFDLMLVSASEYGRYVSMMVYGIDLTDEAQVLSVNDMYTENTFSFIAREIKPFNNNEISRGDLTFKSNKNYNTLAYTTFNWDIDKYKVIHEKPEKKGGPTIYDTYSKRVKEELERVEYMTAGNGMKGDKIEESLNNIMKDMYLENEDKEWFIKDVLPYISKEMIKDNYYFSNNEQPTYTDTKLSEENDKFLANDRVIILDKKTENETNEERFFTDKGWIRKDDIIKDNFEKPSSAIKDVIYNGVSIGDSLLSGNTIEIKGSIEDFLNNFYVKMASDRFETYTTNIRIQNRDKDYLNSVKKEIVNGETNITFKDRIDFVELHHDVNLPFAIILVNNDKNDTALMKFKLVRERVRRS